MWLTEHMHNEVLLCVGTRGVHTKLSLAREVSKYTQSCKLDDETRVRNVSPLPWGGLCVESFHVHPRHNPLRESDGS